MTRYKKIHVFSAQKRAKPWLPEHIAPAKSSSTRSMKYTRIISASSWSPTTKNSPSTSIAASRRPTMRALCLLRVCGRRGLFHPIAASLFRTTAFNNLLFKQRANDFIEGISWHVKGSCDFLSHTARISHNKIKDL